MFYMLIGWIWLISYEILCSMFNVQHRKWLKIAKLTFVSWRDLLLANSVQLNWTWRLALIRFAFAIKSGFSDILHGKYGHVWSMNGSKHLCTTAHVWRLTIANANNNNRTYCVDVLNGRRTWKWKRKMKMFFV